MALKTRLSWIPGFSLIAIPSLMIFVISDLVHTFRIRQLSVPSEVDSGKDASLVCHYELGAVNLYSLTWWKDNEQFFSYTPGRKSTASTKDFKVEGVEVDRELSKEERVVIKNVSQWTAGEFKCEIVSEKFFEKDFKLQNMTVVVMPHQHPVIMHDSRHYSPGDVLEANCTSAKMVPLPDIEGTINKEQLNDSYSESNITKDDELLLYLKTSHLKLPLSERHFDDGEITLFCSASLPDHYNHVSDIKVYKKGSKRAGPSQKLSGSGDRVTCHLALQVGMWTPILIRLLSSP